MVGQEHEVDARIRAAALAPHVSLRLQPVDQISQRGPVNAGRLDQLRLARAFICEDCFHQRELTLSETCLAQLLSKQISRILRGPFQQAIPLKFGRSSMPRPPGMPCRQNISPKRLVGDNPITWCVHRFPRLHLAQKRYFFNVSHYQNQSCIEIPGNSTPKVDTSQSFTYRHRRLRSCAVASMAAVPSQKSW